MELTRQLRGAWTLSRPQGGVIRRAMLLSKWSLIRIEENITDVRYRRLGLDTKRPDMSIYRPGSSRLGYNPVKWRVLRGIFGHNLLGPDDVLLDYGCGKGRVIVWAAAHLPLRQIIGVELDQELHAAANAHLLSWQGQRRCRDVVTFHGDATEFDVPDNVTAIFLYNPFLGEVFNKVIAKVIESVTRRPRLLRVLYVHPKMHDSLLAAGFSVERANVKPPYEWTIYRHNHQSGRMPEHATASPQA